MKVTRQSFSPEQTESIGAALGARLIEGDIVTLQGELGAGKTTFVRGVVRGLGLDASDVSSPTFVLVQEYGPDARDVTIVHVDAYRIGSDDELDSIGWDELLAREDVIVLVEWPERIERPLPDLRTIALTFSHADVETRTIELEIPPTRAGRLSALKPRTKVCASCGETVSIDVPDFPFCSEWCRLADLGDWFHERYRVSRPVDSSDELTE